MSILIKDMKITWENCDDCPVGYDCPANSHMDGYTMNGGRPSFCPAVEISQPHGPLIDAHEELRFYDTDDYDSSVAQRSIMAQIGRYAVGKLPTTIIEPEGNDE